MQWERFTLHKMQSNNKYALLVGIDFILLAINFTVYPIASLDELTLYITSEGSDIYPIYFTTLDCTYTLLTIP